MLTVSLFYLAASNVCIPKGNLKKNQCGYFLDLMRIRF